MNSYEEKREARIARMGQRARKLAGEGEALLKKDDALRGCMNGTPVLVGHHSERRHRRDLERMHNTIGKGLSKIEEARDLQRRAEAAADSTAISSDDPDALPKLHAKLDALEAKHKLMVLGNAAVRKSKGDDALAAKALVDLGFTPKEVAHAMFRAYPTQVPGFYVNNSSANIRNVKQRIAELEKRAAAPVREDFTANGVTVDDVDNRVRIHFPGKPDEATRESLKQSGFRWAPSSATWQRHSSDWAWTLAKQFAEKAARHNGSEGAET